MATLNDWTVVQNSNPASDNINQQPIEQSQSADTVRIQKVLYPNLSESSNCYVEMAPEGNSIQAPLNGTQSTNTQDFEIQFFKYLSIQCLAIGFGTFLGIFRCFGFFFVKLEEQRRYQRWPMDFTQYCRDYYNYSYQDNQCNQHYYKYSNYMDEIVDSREHYRWTFYLLIALIIAQSVAIVLLRKTHLLKRFQRVNYVIQTTFFTCLALSITSYNRWLFLHLWFIPISILLFIICQAQIINVKKYHYQPKLGQIVTVLVYVAFVINTLSALNSPWFVSNLVICEFATVYLVYYLIQLDQSLRANQIQPIEETQQVNITQIVQEICQSDSESIEQAKVEQVSKQYCVLKKKYVYFAGAAFLLALFILSLTHFITFVIGLSLIFNTVFDTQVVSSKAGFEKEDYFLASSLVFIDFACPLKNIYRSIKNARSQ